MLCWCTVDGASGSDPATAHVHAVRSALALYRLVLGACQVNVPSLLLMIVIFPKPPILFTDISVLSAATTSDLCTCLIRSVDFFDIHMFGAQFKEWAKAAAVRLDLL